jgi:hypothetical protein
MFREFITIFSRSNGKVAIRVVDIGSWLLNHLNDSRFDRENVGFLGSLDMFLTRL